MYNILNIFMSKEFSRRDFLKLATAGTAGGVLVACGLNPTLERPPSTRTPAKSTPTEKPTPLPTKTPEPRRTAVVISTPTPTRKPTEVPNTPKPVSTASPVEMRATPTVRPALATPEIKMPLPAVDILDKAYRGYEVLVDKLIMPQDLAVNPDNSSVYCVERLGDGKAEGVFELDSKALKFRFHGAEDPWGNIQQTEVAINRKSELFVYSLTYIDEEISVYNLGSGKRILRIEKPFPDSFGPSRYQPVRSVAANPVDNEFYMSVFKDGPLKSLNVDTGSIKKHTPNNVGYKHGMCFDSSGTAYLGDAFGEYLIKVPRGKNGEKFEFRNLRKVVGDIVGTYEEFDIDGLSYDYSNEKILMNGIAFTKDYIQKGGGIRLPNFILSVDPRSRIISPVAVLSSSAPLLIGGLDVGKNGDIYVSTHNGAFAYKQANGGIFRLIKN